ncbi:MAG: hypothetical protein ASUL_09194 [Candidatus Aramenus sulfurataquae]|uniref:UPF0248 protein ASUL_09194 n=1 Tax=Candidatus Aramenus sulfurataquae TaxID=1326980 RepID=W7L4J3_9CREN|nr:MAG: hypothetical protein ASUL_09194 [Candidatus Aramenus sulfurataquae]MBW9141965.1 DUF504 domain-containing protein [Candidatus Aramenus sp.]
MIRDEINRVLWSKGPIEDYTLVVWDRFKGLIEIPFTSISRVDKNYVYLNDDTVIPIHRVREIRKKGRPTWKRGERSS